MLRYNIFNMIHKALRFKLYDTALTLQQTWFADEADAAAAFDKLNEVIDAFEKHGHHEDSILMPFIERFQSATIASFEKDHIDDRVMGYDLKHLHLKIKGWQWPSLFYCCLPSGYFFRKQEQERGTP